MVSLQPPTNRCAFDLSAEFLRLQTWRWSSASTHIVSQLLIKATYGLLEKRIFISLPPENQFRICWATAPAHLNHLSPTENLNARTSSSIPAVVFCHFRVLSPGILGRKKQSHKDTLEQNNPWEFWLQISLTHDCTWKPLWVLDQKQNTPGRKQNQTHKSANLATI